MTGFPWFAAIALGAIVTAEASGQFLPYPPPYYGVPLIGQSEIDFYYQSRRLRIAGSVGTGGSAIGLVTASPYPPGFYAPYYPGYYPLPLYGSASTRITVQVIKPPVIVQQRRSLAPYTQDVAGIDLDDEPPSKIWGKKAGVQVAAAKIAPPEKQKNDAMQAKAPGGALPPPAPPVKVDFRPEWERQMDDGIVAFQNGDFGIAALRFRRANEALAPARAWFLLGQAYIAVGKYDDAAESLQQGLKLQPGWLGSGFRPRVELYGAEQDAWKEHRTRLEQVQRDHPKNADYLFLLGYVAWFDARPEAAVDYFQASRLLTADTRWADMFLKAAMKN